MTKKATISLLLLLAMFFSLGVSCLQPAAAADADAAAETDAAALLAEGVGFWYGTGGNGYDKEKALDALRRAAAAGNADAYYYLGEIESAGARPGRAEHVLKYYQKAAELGSPLGLYGQGLAYRDGRGVPEDPGRAKELFEQALEKGCELARIGLGLLYEDDGDAQQAVACYEALLDSENWLARNQALCRLGRLYRDGAEGLKSNAEKALACYTQAADDGYVGGMSGAGDMYYFGDGVEQDGEKCYPFFAAEAEHGSWYDLGFLYLNGFGVEQDYGKAAELFRKDIAEGTTPVSSLYPLACVLADGLDCEADKDAAAALCREGLAAVDSVDSEDFEFFSELLEELGETVLEPRKNAGLYELTAVMNGGERLTPEEANVSGSLLLRGDGTALLMLNGSESELPGWTEEEKLITLSGGTGNTLDCEIEDGVITAPFGEGYDLLFSRAEGVGEASLLFPLRRAIDPEAGVHLRYTCHTEYMDALISYDVHTRADVFYSERLTKAGGLKNRTADFYKDGTAYTLYPDKKTGSVATTFSPSLFAGRMALIDDLYKLIFYASRRTDYSLEIRMVEELPYVVEHYPASTLLLFQRRAAARPCERNGPDAGRELLYA